MSRGHIASTHVPWLAKRKVLVEFGTDQFGHDLVQCAANRVDFVKPAEGDITLSYMFIKSLNYISLS